MREFRRLKKKQNTVKVVCKSCLPYLAMSWSAKEGLAESLGNEKTHKYSQSMLVGTLRSRPMDHAQERTVEDECMETRRHKASSLSHTDFLSVLDKILKSHVYAIVLNCCHRVFNWSTVTRLNVHKGVLFQSLQSLNRSLQLQQFLHKSWSQPDNDLNVIVKSAIFTY